MVHRLLRGHWAAFEGVPVSVEIDPETGQVTAYNDDLRVMAIAHDEATARQRFYFLTRQWRCKTCRLRHTATITRFDG
jgi:hypothetical protein